MTRVAVYMSYEENYALTFSAPVRISWATPNTMEVVPWNIELAQYWDYQHLGANPAWGSFMAIWNDRRLTSQDPLLWSDLLYYQ